MGLSCSAGGGLASQQCLMGSGGFSKERLYNKCETFRAVSHVKHATAPITLGVQQDGSVLVSAFNSVLLFDLHKLCFSAWGEGLCRLHEAPTICC